LDAIAKRYSIPTTEMNGWRAISESSVQRLWEKAKEKLEGVNQRRKNAQGRRENK
jgi:hypothetical protein